MKEEKKNMVYEQWVFSLNETHFHCDGRHLYVFVTHIGSVMMCEMNSLVPISSILVIFSVKSSFSPPSIPYFLSHKKIYSSFQ